MKKIKIIISIVLAWLLIFSLTVFAAEPQISIEGADTVKPGETKTMTVKISSDIEVGVVSGKIEKNANITNIKPTGKNNWNLTYNPETGDFNIYKAEGSKQEEIMSIEYTAGNDEGVGKITINEIDLTTIDYETTEVGNILKEIVIENTGTTDTENVALSGIEITKAPTKVTYKEGEKFDISGMEITAKYSDGTSKVVTNFEYTPSGSLKTSNKTITISYIENGVTKTVEQKITVVSSGNNNQEKDNSKDDTASKNDIPKSGVTSYAIVIVVVIAIVAYISYLRYNKFKNV